MRFISEDAITEKSKGFFLEHRKEIGKIRLIKCFANFKRAIYRTTIYGDKGQIVVFGFSYGYGGEGPRGLMWLVNECGLHGPNPMDKAARNLISYDNGFTKNTVERHKEYFGRLLWCEIGETIHVDRDLICKSGRRNWIQRNKIAILERNFAIQPGAIDSYGRIKWWPIPMRRIK